MSSNTVPAAPYPPMTLKSSMRTLQHYSARESTPDDSYHESDKLTKSFAPKIRWMTSKVLASIHCHPSSTGRHDSPTITPNQQDPLAPSTSSSRDPKRKGPVLVRLHQIKLNNHRTGYDHQTHSEQPTSRDLFTFSEVATAHGNPSLGSSVTPTCLDTSAAHIIATGLSTGALCVCAFPQDGVYQPTATVSAEYYHTARQQHRFATAVQWRPHYQAHVAISLFAQPSAGSVTPTARASSNPTDFGCYIWDAEGSRKARSTPLVRLAHQTSVTSLAWVLENGNTLALGQQLRNLQLYDLRSPSTTPVATSYAHDAAVNGIVPCPNASHLLATYSSSVNEPVKLWDARRLDACLAEIKIPYQNSSGAEQDVVKAMQWGTDDILSLAVQDSILEWDVTTSVARPVQSAWLHSPQELADLASWLTQRTIVAYKDGTLGSLARRPVAPLTISHRDGRLVHCLESTLWMGPTTDGPTAMEHAHVPKEEDISATMMRRARCLHIAKYSMDTSANIKILAEDGIARTGELSNYADSSRTQDALLRLWSWIERVENLCAQGQDDWDGNANVWSAKSLSDAGAYRLITNDPVDTEDQQDFSQTLACLTYKSPGRRACLTASGWAGSFGLENVLGECEELREYERAAALAVWHGDLMAAIESLQRGADYFRSLIEEETTNDPRASVAYIETLDLISLSIAGFRGGDYDLAAGSIWRKTCANLMHKRDLTGSVVVSGRASYIVGILKFLTSLGSENGYSEILNYESLSLCDRVAFACRFLPRTELVGYMDHCIASCQRSGNIEGIVITGVEQDGLKILQSYVDRHADVQTAALVTSRVIFPPNWIEERRVITEWVENYRSFLNHLQMWQSRAIFDVERAELLRNRKARILDSASAKVQGVQSRRIQQQGRRPGPKQPDPDVQASIPAQLDARCNYCSSPLGLKHKDSHANQWLSKMKPILSCCPQCRKPLPRCAVCMLSMGQSNPYLELTKERSRPRGATGSQIDDYSSLANLPFAEWFTWCLRCKHGGHAHHLVGWFHSHDVCPVSGCSCMCQFDGIRKINRPALSKQRLPKHTENKAVVDRVILASEEG